MDTSSGTIVNAEMLKKLYASGLATGFEPVPVDLQKEAEVLLAGKQVADMDDDFKRKLRNRNKAKRRAGVLGY